MAGWADIWSGADLVTGGGSDLGSGYDWLGGFDDLFGGGDSGGAFDWTDAAQDIYDSSGGGGSGGGSNWMQNIAKMFSNDGQGGGGYSDIFGAMLAGLGGAAQAYMDKDAIAEAGKESRRTIEYGSALDDYYKQKDTERKRLALDTYGQFSLMDRWAPGYRPAPKPPAPVKPGI